MKNIFFTFFSICFIFSKIFGQQEVELPLNNNNILKPSSDKNNYLYKIMTVPIQLPFIDDFSGSSIYPSYELWEDSSVFINNNFPIDPLTVGVATFDGVDKYGNPYDNSTPTTHGSADTLTSKIIDLLYQPFEDVKLSFFVQPQGRGNAPENIDSLYLEFLDINGNWIHIWSIPGTNNVPFAQYIIDITDLNFLYTGFRFRFRNYATLSGNVDHWHLDYVRLDKGVNHTIIDDVAFAEYPRSLLNVYQEIPWSHYLVNPSQYTQDSLIVRVKNNTVTTPTVSFRDNIYDASGNIILAIPPTTFSLPINNFFIYNKPVSFTFPPTPSDSASFLIEHILNTTPDILRANDTVRRWQNFYNHYAYDDGTAEAAYGFINAPNAKMAMRFDLAKADTLRAINIFWNQLNYSADLLLFRLAVWTSINPEVLLYQQIDETPNYVDSINGFYTYKLNVPQYVSGTFYIGLIQNGTENMNLGLDKNFTNNPVMFFNTSGSWTNSLIQGTWMIRPVLGQDFSLTSVTDLSNENNIFIYPNPAKDFLNFNQSGIYTCEILNIHGQVIKKYETISGRIEISELSSGIYFIRAKEVSTSAVINARFVVID